MENINTIAKEVFITLKYFDDDVIKKIPKSFLDSLKELALNSNHEVYIDTKIGLEKQNISEESKDLIALICYSYIANEEEKKQIEKCWDQNEKEYQEMLKEKYNINSIFKSKIKNKKRELKEETKDTINKLLVIRKEENLLDKIISIIKNWFKK